MGTARQHQRSRGFTLLEVMVVLGIVVAVVAFGIPRLMGPNTQIRGAVRKFASLTRETQNQAKLTGAMHRIVIDMKKGAGVKGEAQIFWVERSQSKTVLSPRDLEARKEALSEGKVSVDDEREAGEARPDWEPAPRLGAKKHELPSGLFFDEVEFNGNEKGIREGLVYIHFFPQGMAEEAAIHLTGGDKLNWTLAISPLTGYTTVIPERVRLKELQEP